MFATVDEDLRSSQTYRTLFIRQLVADGVLGPSAGVSSALTEADIDRMVDVVADACAVTGRRSTWKIRPRGWMGGR